MIRHSSVFALFCFVCLLLCTGRDKALNHPQPTLQYVSHFNKLGKAINEKKNDPIAKKLITGMCEHTKKCIMHLDCRLISGYFDPDWVN